MPFDTLKIAKQMEAAGMPRPQSEALATVLQDEFDDQIVTNQDLGVAVDRLESRIDAVDTKLSARIDGVESKIDAVRTELGSRIGSVEARLTMMQWMLGLNFAATLGILWKLLR